MNSTMTVVEQIAQTIEDWGDGWRYLANPDDHGRRARLVRFNDEAETISIELEIRTDCGHRYLFSGCRVRMYDGHWQEVSLSIRNPTTRKAIDYINAELDRAEA